MSNTDKIYKAIETISGRFINALHGESNRYAFRYLDGTWDSVWFDFANDIAGLGAVNKDLLD